MTRKPRIRPFSPFTRHSVSQARRTFAEGGMPALTDYVREHLASPGAAQAALVLAIATESWTPAERAALDRVDAA